MVTTPQQSPVAANDGQFSLPDVLLALESTEYAHVAFRSPDGAIRSAADRFHWNGSEIVLCSLGPASWSQLEGNDVAVSIGTGATLIEWYGVATADQVLGVAPEFRAAAVRYLGPERGNAVADAIRPEAEMHRLFVTPVRKVTAG